MILSGFVNIIVDINSLNKLELSNVSIIRRVTLYTKDSIENVKGILLKIKDTFAKEERLIEITAKRVSQNKVLIFCPTVGFEIHIYNLFFDFENLLQVSKIPIMLEYSYHNFAFLQASDMDQEWNKIKFLEHQFFQEPEKKSRLSRRGSQWRPATPEFIRKSRNPDEFLLIGLHRFGFEIGPQEWIYVGSGDIRNFFGDKKRYNLVTYKGDFRLRGPFYEVYDLKEGRTVFRIYQVGNRCIPKNNYTLFMKFMMANFFLPRPIIRNLDVIQEACRIILGDPEVIRTAGDFECIGMEVSDQYRFEMQIWEQPKWLFKIKI